MPTLTFDDLMDTLSAADQRQVGRLLETNPIDLGIEDEQTELKVRIFDGRAMNVLLRFEEDACFIVAVQARHRRAHAG